MKVKAYIQFKYALSIVKAIPIVNLYFTNNLTCDNVSFEVMIFQAKVELSNKNTEHNCSVCFDLPFCLEGDVLTFLFWPVCDLWGWLWLRLWTTRPMEWGCPSGGSSVVLDCLPPHVFSAALIRQVALL